MKTKIAATCPRCGPTVVLVERRRRGDGERFWGCPRWYDKAVRCSYTQEIPEEIKIRELGQPELPGLF